MEKEFNIMEVTSVYINYIKRNTFDKVKAYAEIVLNDQLLIKGIKIVITNEKRYVVFPEEILDPTSTRGQHIVISYANPIKNELREHITQKIFEKFDVDPHNPKNRKVINNINSMDE